MAKMWFVMVLLIAQNVYAIDKNEDINQSCDMCIASGKNWCLQKTKEGHCYDGSNDDACSEQEEINYDNSREEGDLLHPKALHETLTANVFTPTELKYDSSIQRNIAIIYDVDLKDIINVKEGETKCDGQHCEVQIEAIASSEFCSRNLTSVEVIIKVENFSEIAKFTYDVACSCPCTKQKVHKSPRCNGHGTFRCGICLCDDEWHGDYCEEACESRGDIKDVCTGENGKECSGNGKCVCNGCQCSKYKEGSQYFNEQEKCSDICMQTMEFHDCLRNDSVECHNGNGMKHLTVLPLNETTAINEKNESNRTVWILCKNYEEECNLEYYVRRTEERYYAMIKKKCGIIAAGSLAAAAGSNVPLILGVLALVAIVAAAGGFVLWKHMNALPQPSASPCYENIVPDDCQGINPIYQSPTTKFVNPTYGKC